VHWASSWRWGSFFFVVIGVVLQVDFYSYSNGRLNCSRVSFLIEMSISLVTGRMYSAWGGGVFNLYLASLQLLGVCTVFGAF
jgi:hypothetical protein